MYEHVFTKLMTGSTLRWWQHLTTGLNPLDAAAALAHKTYVLRGGLHFAHRPALADHGGLDAIQHLWHSERAW